MAAELSFSSRVNFSKSGVSLAKDLSQTADITTARAANFTAAVGTSETEIEIPGIINARLIAIKNHDLTNFVTVGFATGAHFAKLQKGDIAIIPVDAGTTSIFATADTAACLLEIIAINT